MPGAPAGRRRVLGIATAAALATAALAWAGVAWWWRDVPAFRGAETFLTLKSELAQVGLEPRERNAAEEGFAIELRSSRGWTVHGHLRVPITNPPERMPAIVVLGGIGTGRHAAHLVHTRRPHVILGLDYPWAGSRRPGPLEILRSLPEIRRAVLLSPAALLLAADYLTRRPDVREDQLTAVGASFGVPFVTTAASLDRRYDVVLLLYGGGDFRELIRTNLKRRNPRAPAGLARLAARVVDPVEPLRYVGSIAPRPVVMVNGLQDERIPDTSVRALFEAAGEPKTLVWLDTRHISPRDDELLRAIADTAIRILETLEGVLPTERSPHGGRHDTPGRPSASEVLRPPRAGTIVQ